MGLRRALSTLSGGGACLAGGISGLRLTTSYTSMCETTSYKSSMKTMYMYPFITTSVPVAAMQTSTLRQTNITLAPPTFPYK